MTDALTGTARSRWSAVLDFAKSAEPRPRPSGRVIALDILLAVALAAASMYTARFNSHAVIATVLICGPLAVRRRFPLAVFLVILGFLLATKHYATYYTFVALVIAAYSAAVHGRYRGAGLLVLAPAGVVVATVFWNTTSRILGPGAVLAGGGNGGPPGPVTRMKIVPQVLTALPGKLAELSPNAPWRVTGLLVLVSLASIAIVGVATYTADRIRLLTAEHQTATRRAIELERARIASELHDVVTHNVSVMIVQAGAARQVLASDPREAKEALLAVESSGRAAMSELRSLLGLLSPPTSVGPQDGSSTDAAGADQQAEDLRPQPGLGQIKSLVGRVRKAGLPVELDLGSVPDGLPPGVDLAAFRVIQEGLTNVIKHAGKPHTTVRLDYRDGDLLVEVADDGPPIPAAGPIASGAGRGLLGLRERTALYGGELAAGPVPGGGWSVRARIPAVPLAETESSAGTLAAKPQ
jgi:signal transduction histidine kinase